MASDGNIPSVEQNSTAEIIAEDDFCPVCQLLLYRPVTTSCNHTLCESCMKAWANVSITRMEIVDIDAEPIEFDPVSGLEAKCPMCRTYTHASINQSRTDELKEMYPKTYQDREAEETRSDSSGESNIETLTLCVGNRHRSVTPREDEHELTLHEWSFLIRPSRADIIEEVHIHLHPTFRPSRIIRTRAPYEVSRRGWGVFYICADLILKAGYSWLSNEAVDSPDGAERGMIEVRWYLDFNDRGSLGRMKLKVKNQRNWDVDAQAKEDERVWSRTVRQYEQDGTYVPDDER